MVNSRLIFGGKQIEEGNVGATKSSIPGSSSVLAYREEEGVTVEASEPKKRQNKAVKQVTMEEVAKHSTEEDLWIVVERKVLLPFHFKLGLGFKNCVLKVWFTHSTRQAYDITKFARAHPGGHLPLIAMAGKVI